MKSNPQRYAEMFMKESRSDRKGITPKAKSSKEKKEVPVTYIVNEHSGTLQQLKEVQNPCCRKCYGKTYETVQTQVTELDINMKYISSTATQCTLISTGNDRIDEVETNDACTMYDEQEENNIASETNYDVIKSSTAAGTNTTEIHTVVDTNNHGYEDNIQDGRRTEAKRNQYGGDKVQNDDEVILDQFNEQVYLRFCHEKLYDGEMMNKLVEVLHDNSSLEDFMSLVTQLAYGTLDPMNMAFLLKFLEE